MTSLFSDLWLFVNSQSWSFVPLRGIPFLGSILDSMEGRAFLPEDILIKMSQYLLKIQSCPTQSIKVLLGLKATSTYMTLFAHQRMSPWQHWIFQVCRPSWDSFQLLIAMPQSTILSLGLWLDQMNMLRVYISITQTHVEHWFETCQTVVGAHLNHMTVWGHCFSEGIFLHFGVLELRAVHLALMPFLPHLQGNVVHILMDNTSVMYYISKWGGVLTLLSCVQRL